ncbi:hypothetical protein ABW19_dt0206892 [Dactylella cylindrospora]|nr:hypothetical protein ABW19_dt0206892 [Dactylella cylindrospora]
MSKTVLIAGATGNQGAATLKALQSLPEASDLTIRALVRDPTSKGSKKLESQGIQLFKGNLTDKTALQTALTGADTAFLVTIPIPNPEAEVTQGKAFIDAAVASGTVKYIVMTSVGSAERHTGVPHFETKREVEKYLIASGLSYMIVRPVAFMDNYPLEGFGRFMALGMFKTFLEEKRVQLVAAEDIGAFAAKAIIDQKGWEGKAIELAGDEKSVKEMADVWEKFFYDDGYKADIPALKKIYPGLLSFEDFLRQRYQDKSS